MKIEKEMWAVVNDKGEIIESTIAADRQSTIWMYNLNRSRITPPFYIAQQLGYTCQKVKVTIEVIEQPNEATA